MASVEKILIVDDNERARSVLEAFVVPLGYTPVLAQDGPSALERMRADPPDVVLLDIMMPGMDGRAVLEQMKDDTKLRHVPVVMISALDDLDTVAKCIEMGADDYLVKPFNPTFLRARLASALSKKRLHDQEAAYQQQVEEYNRRLEDRVREKTKQLAEAHERLTILDKAKSDFLMLISHELRTPLTGVFGAAEVGLFDRDLDEESLNELQSIFQASYGRLLAIIDQALLLTRIEISGETFPVEPNPIRSILDSAVEMSSRFAETRKVELPKPPESSAYVMSEMSLLTKALAALMETAVKFSEEGRTIVLTCEPNKETVRIGIRAFGRTVPEDALPKFFEVFSIPEPITPGGDLGLGPPVAERAIELFGGSVKVENQAPPGILFTVTLKSAPPPETSAPEQS